jgi:hypothetical protein
MLLEEIINRLPEQDSGEHTLYEPDRMLISWMLAQNPDCYARLAFDFRQHVLSFHIDNSSIQGSFPVIEMTSINEKEHLADHALFEQFITQLENWAKNPLLINENTKDYSLWRLDDNNNHFEMERGLSFAQAKKKALMYEQRGHKQSYYIQKTA